MDASLVTAFLTGLTAGGLSCMAVQGGLVTSSLAGQIESEISSPKRGNKSAKTDRAPLRLARPIVLFLAAKLLAYTALGFVLGSIGSALSLTPTLRGILQIAIALFMLGNALRLLNVHPIFRYFSFEPPAAVRRMIRQKAKNQENIFSPVLLGFLTLLIPCGVTQSMMALAISSGSALSGSLLLFAFTLGASPVFFLLTYLASKLGSLTEKYFTRLVVIVLLVFGLITFDTGLNLVGFPLTVSRLSQQLRGEQPAAVQASQNRLGQTQNLPANTSINSGNDVYIQVENQGYSPYKSIAKAGEQLTLHLTTDQVYSCSRAFVIPALDISKLLYASGEETIQIPAQKAGTELYYSCSMGMYSGVIVFE
jgi:sulfite exporter TauE/SafE